MTKVKYNVKGVEPGQDFDTPLPQGMYLARIDEATLGKSQSSSNERIALTLVVVGGEYENRRIWDYVTLTDESAWKMRQFLEAIGEVGDGKSESGTLDLDAVIGQLVRVRVRHENDRRPETLEANNGNPVVRHRVGALLPTEDGVEDEEPEDEPEQDEPEADEPEDDGELTYEELEGYNRTELKQLIKDNDLDIRVTKNMKTDTIREKIAEEFELEPSEEEGDEPEEDEAPDYDEMSHPDLKATCQERGLPTGGTKPTLIKRLRKDDANDGDDEPF